MFSDADGAMYDRSNMQRPASHGYPVYSASAPPKQTSSAFSPSANPSEDWTKITDLAERRRIQNRIAQRNYRKKLKKRLEDLERRAGSSSPSPEAEPDETVSQSRDRRRRSSGDGHRRNRTPEEVQSQPIGSAHRSAFAEPFAEQAMFSEQSTRQLSTSPPPNGMGFSTSYPPAAGYYGMSLNRMDMPLYPQHLSGYAQQYDGLPSVGSSLSTPPMKQEPYNDDEMSPFGMSYASMAGVGVPAAQTYHDMAAYTPPLSDAFEFAYACSPPDSTAYPRTPSSLPRTPPMRFFEE